MPIVQAETTVPLPPEKAFAVSQTTGATRLRWDPFVRRQKFLDDATAPAKGVRTLTVHRSGIRMVSEYVAFSPPTNAGMRMVSGPWFFEMMAGGWRFTSAGEGYTRAVWKYNFRCRPRWLAPVAEWIGVRVLGREIRQRIAGFASGCADQVVLDAVTAEESDR